MDRLIESVSHSAEMASAAIQNAAAYYERPSFILRPKVYPDGNKWCALYGDNLQEGIAGFGDSPAKALYDFDRAFHEDMQ